MKRFTWLLVFLMTVGVVLLPGVASGLTEAGYESYTLPNGLTVVLREMRYQDIVTIGLAVKAGQELEVRVDDYGINFWTSFMLNYGTSRRRNYQSVVDPIRQNGGLFSIMPTASLTLIRTKTTRQNYESAFDTVGDLAQNGAFEPALTNAVMSYYGGIIDSMRYEGSSLGYRKMLNALFGEHPYGHDATGTGRSVRLMDWTRLKKHYDTYFVPNNAILIVTGNFETEKVKEQITAQFGSWKRGVVPNKPLPPAAPKAGATMNSKGTGNQAHVFMGFRVPGIQEKDGPAIAVLNAIWGSGLGSRIFQDLRTKHGLAYSCTSEYEWLEYNNPSLMYAYLGTAPDKVNDVVEGLKRQVTEFKEQPVSEDELARGKTIFINSLRRDMQENNALIMYMAHFEALGLGYGAADKLIELAGKVSVEDVQRVANQYLNEPVISTVKP